MNSQFKNSSLGFYLYAFLIIIIVAAVAFVFWFMISGYKLGTYEENTLLGSVYVGGLKEEEVEPIMNTRIERWLGDETILFEVKYQGYSYTLDRELFDFNVVESIDNINGGQTNKLVVEYGGSKREDVIDELKSLVFLQGIKENIDYDQIVRDVIADASLMKSFSVKNIEDYLIDESASMVTINSVIVDIPNNVSGDELISSINNVYESGKVEVKEKYFFDLIEELGEELDNDELTLLASSFLKLIHLTNFSVNEIHYENVIPDNYRPVLTYPKLGSNALVFERENLSFSFYNPNQSAFYFEFTILEGNQLEIKLIGLEFVNTIRIEDFIQEIPHIDKVAEDGQDLKEGVEGVIVEFTRIITDIYGEELFNQVIIEEFYPPEVGLTRE